MAATNNPTVITVVEAPACHYCEDAAAALAELSARFDFLVRTLARDSDEGRRLILRHRPPMAPLVLVDEEFFSSGRLPRRLEKLLQLRAAAA